MSRRIYIAVLLIFISTQTSAVGQTKILFIGKEPDHPYGSHMYLHTCEVLAKCLRRVDGVQTVESNGWPRNPQVVDGNSAIVIYTSPAAELLLDGPHRDAVDQLMREGVGLVTIHWASTVYEKNLERLGPQWLKYLGGTWISNVGLHTGKSPLRQLQPDHPICRGWDEYELHDEYYLNPKLTEAAAPLLQVTANSRPVIVGWTYQRENDGRSVGITLGHFYRNFQLPAFRRLIVNSVLWTAHIEIPESGADVELSADDLALPPNK